MFTPALPIGGLSGWRLLQSTYTAQREAFDASAQLQRETDFFKEKIGSITSAEDLVADRQLLTVALGAFGLQDDINNRYFIKKMLEEGTTANDALANRFSDSRYREFSEAFGFGPSEVTQTSQAGFADDIVERYLTNSFEVATGDVDETMRFALYLERTMPELSGAENSEEAKWFTIMGQPALRSAFETVLGLPSAFGQIDIDQQLTVFQDRAQSIFGSSDPAQFAEPEALDDLVTAYVARAQISAASSSVTSQSIALQLLGA